MFNVLNQSYNVMKQSWLPFKILVEIMNDIENPASFDDS